MKLYGCFLFLLLQSCIQGSIGTDIGIRENYRSYIPARTAVLSCVSLESPTNLISEKQRAEFCKSVDLNVLSSFDDQKFMQGYTPSAVESVLKKKKRIDLLKNLISMLSSDFSKCSDCINFSQFYEKNIRTKIEWESLLLEFSKNVFYSDAILIPIIVSVKEEHVDDRGLLLSTRHIDLELLLIDTQKGDLIWNSKKTSSLSEKKLRSPEKYPPYPEWASVINNLLTESLWREYPGKIFL